jgi:type III secretion system YscD/HrpQ family protein
MAAYLIGETGPLSGLVIRLETGEEWILGRDPESATIVLEDPTVSRKHVICRRTPEGYSIENLSSTNPAKLNGNIIVEPADLKEGDLVEIGGTGFRFSEKAPMEKPKIEPIPAEGIEEPEIFEEVIEAEPLKTPFTGYTRWVIKVVSGPNSGAEFNLPTGSSKIVGKDPNTCDIILQDLSVSRQHARITIDANNHAVIEDLKSKNGVIVNGELIKEKKEILSQDLIALGTTSFLIIDRELERETIVAAPKVTPLPAPEKKEEEKKEEAAEDWRDIIIPKRHLVIAGAMFAVIVALFFGIIALFKTEPITIAKMNYDKEIREKLEAYPMITYSFNEATGSLFLTGHVLTEIDKLEMLYLINALPFVERIDDNVIVDQYVWQSFNSLLAANHEWEGVSVHSYSPGKFVLNGYVNTVEQLVALNDYINMNFPYLDKLENRVVAETNLATQIQSILIQNGFGETVSKLTDGEVVLLGRVNEERKDMFLRVVDQIQSLHGVRVLHNYVIMATGETSRIDLSSKYKVQGETLQDHKVAFVVINGKILGIGNTLDEMTITEIEPNEVLLEKDGLKFKINYNLQ